MGHWTEEKKKQFILIIEICEHIGKRESNLWIPSILWKWRKETYWLVNKWGEIVSRAKKAKNLLKSEEKEINFSLNFEVEKKKSRNLWELV